MNMYILFGLYGFDGQTKAVGILSFLSYFPGQASVTNCEAAFLTGFHVYERSLSEDPVVR